MGQAGARARAHIRLVAVWRATAMQCRQSINGTLAARQSHRRPVRCVTGYIWRAEASRGKRTVRVQKAISWFESRHPHHSVEDRTSLHFLTPQNGHFLGKRERLSARKGNFGSNSQSQRLNDAQKAPYLWAFSHGVTKNRETGLVGWRASADRTSLHPPFPANREFYREFRRVDGFAGPRRAEFQRIIGLFSTIPWNQEQGNLRCEQGLIIKEHGLARCRTPAGQSTTLLSRDVCFTPKADMRRRLAAMSALCQ